jgi:chitosanase
MSLSGRLLVGLLLVPTGLSACSSPSADEVVSAPTAVQTGSPAPTSPGATPSTGPSPTRSVAAPTASTGPTAGGSRQADLTDPRKKDIALQLVSSAENSSLNWKAQYKYIQDIGDVRGYTGGIIGFCSGTADMLHLVETYTARKPGNWKVYGDSYTINS